MKSVLKISDRLYTNMEVEVLRLTGLYQLIYI
jgi:hypothetical protein